MVAYNPNQWAFIDPMVPYGYTAPPAPAPAADPVARYTAGLTPGGDGAGGTGGGRVDPGRSAGTPQSTGDMFRDSYAMAREMSEPTKGGIAGSIIGGLLGLGPIGGTLGSWAQSAYNTTMGAREGNAARAGIGSGVPSQHALGAWLDELGPMDMNQRIGAGLPATDDWSGLAHEQGGYDTQNNAQGWGLADREAADMANAGIDNGDGSSDPNDPGPGIRRGGAIRRKRKFAHGGALRMASIYTPPIPRPPSAAPKSPRTLPSTMQAHLRVAPRRYLSGR